MEQVNASKAMRGSLIEQPSEQKPEFDGGANPDPNENPEE